ncbi:hypothetical protein ACHAXA_000714 [Cyclostephanos tholiformis]|uniref:Uncharacterized protein n=1 Tax=Cyclostephanos tholiformis TaxID=382380 RepID=A0ABD3RRA2_9STRA
MTPRSLTSTRSPSSDNDIDQPSIDVLELDDPAKMSPHAIVAELRYYGVQVSQVGIDDRSTLQRALVEARRQSPRGRWASGGGGRDHQDPPLSRTVPQHYDTPSDHDDDGGINFTHIPLLPGNRIPPQIANVIRTSADPSMRSIKLDSRALGDAEVIKLSRAMEVNRTVTSLSLRNCSITDAGVSGGLAHMLKVNKTLLELLLDDNRIGNEGAASLGTALIMNEALNVLTLSGNTTLGDAGVSYLIGALEHNVTIRKLDVSNCAPDANARGRAGQIEEMLCDRQIDSTFESLLERLVDDDYHVTGIDLSGRRIGNGGAIRLADALSDNTHVRQLWLRGCNIGDDGARGLASCLEQNMSIIDLYLANNVIGDDGLIAISDALATNNSTLVSFELDNNDVGVIGLRAFIRAIETNTSVLTASFENNPKLSMDSSSPQMVSDLLAKLKDKLDGMNRAAFIVDPDAASQTDDTGIVNLSVCSSYMPSTYRRAGMDSQAGGASNVRQMWGNPASSKRGSRAHGAAPPPPLPYPRQQQQVQRPTSSSRQRQKPDPEDSSRRKSLSSRPISGPPTVSVGSSSQWQQQQVSQRQSASSQQQRVMSAEPTPAPQSVKYERSRAPTPNNARALQTIMEQNNSSSKDIMNIKRSNSNPSSRRSESPRNLSQAKEELSKKTKSTSTTKSSSSPVVSKASSHEKPQNKTVTPRPLPNELLLLQDTKTVVDSIKRPQTQRNFNTTLRKLLHNVELTKRTNALAAAQYRSRRFWFWSIPISLSLFTAIVLTLTCGFSVDTDASRGLALISTFFSVLTLTLVFLQTKFGNSSHASLHRSAKVEMIQVAFRLDKLVKYKGWGLISGSHSTESCASAIRNLHRIDVYVQAIRQCTPPIPRSIHDTCYLLTSRLTLICLKCPHAVKERLHYKENDWGDIDGDANLVPLDLQIDAFNLLEEELRTYLLYPVFMPNAQDVVSRTIDIFFADSRDIGSVVTVDSRSV